jgi:hypothetical protein
MTEITETTKVLESVEETLYLITQLIVPDSLNLFLLQDGPGSTSSTVPKEQTGDVSPKVESEVRTHPDGGSATSFNEMTSEDPAQVSISRYHLLIGYFSTRYETSVTIHHKLGF